MPRMHALRRSVPAVLLCAATLGACGGGDDAARAREDALRSELKGEIDKTRKDLDRASQQMASARDEARSLRDEVGALSARVAELEARPVAGGDAAGAAGAVAAPKPPAVPDKKALLAEMKALQDKVFSGDATDEEVQRFWELARSTSVVDDLMKTLDAKVKEHPDDLEGRMQLAQAYISKLQTVPSGMEQGMWSQRAEAQWREVLKRDPDHWDARFSMALGWTFWPEQFNKTPDAIKEFEKVREVQERQPIDSKHAQTYLQLSRLYQKQGKADKAKDILRTGRARHPDDAELKKTLASLEE